MADFEVTLYRIAEGVEGDGLQTTAGPHTYRRSTSDTDWIVEGVGDLTISVENDEGIFTPDSVEILFFDPTPNSPTTIDSDFFNDYNDPKAAPWCVKFIDHDVSAVPFFAGYIEPTSIRYDAKLRKFSAEVFSFEHLLSRYDSPARYVFETTFIENYQIGDNVAWVRRTALDGSDLNSVIAVGDVIVFDRKNVGETRATVAAVIVESDRIGVKFALSQDPLVTIDPGAATSILLSTGLTETAIINDLPFPIQPVIITTSETAMSLMEHTTDNLTFVLTSEDDTQQLVAAYKPGPKSQSSYEIGTINEFRVMRIELQPLFMARSDDQYYDFDTGQIDETHPTYGKLANFPVQVEVFSKQGADGGDEDSTGDKVKFLGKDVYGFAPVDLRDDYAFVNVLGIAASGKGLFTVDLGDAGVLKHLVNTISSLPNPFTDPLPLHRYVEYPTNLLQSLKMILAATHKMIRFDYAAGTNGRTRITPVMPSRETINTTAIPPVAFNNPISWTEDPVDLSWPTAVVIEPNKEYMKPDYAPKPVGFWYDGIASETEATRKDLGVPEGEGVLNIKVCVLPSYEGMEADADTDTNVWEYGGGTGTFAGGRVFNDHKLRSIAKIFYEYYANLPRKGRGKFATWPVSTDLVGKFVTTSELDFAPDTLGRTFFIEKATYHLEPQEITVEGRIGEYEPAINENPVARITGPRIFYDHDADGDAAVILSGSNSYDPLDGKLTYLWKEGAATLGTDAVLNVDLANGDHDITLTVTNQDANTDNITVTVSCVQLDNPIGPRLTEADFRWEKNIIQRDDDLYYGEIKMFPNFPSTEIRSTRYRRLTGGELPSLDRSAGDVEDWYPHVPIKRVDATGAVYYSYRVLLTSTWVSTLEVYVELQHSQTEPYFTFPFTFNAIGEGVDGGGPPTDCLLSSDKQALYAHFGGVFINALRDEVLSTYGKLLNSFRNYAVDPDAYTRPLTDYDGFDFFDTPLVVKLNATATEYFTLPHDIIGDSTLGEFTVFSHVRNDDPTAEVILWKAETVDANAEFEAKMLTSGVIRFSVTNNAGTTVNLDTTFVVPDNANCITMQSVNLVDGSIYNYVLVPDGVSELVGSTIAAPINGDFTDVRMMVSGKQSFNFSHWLNRVVSNKTMADAEAICIEDWVRQRNGEGVLDDGTDDVFISRTTAGIKVHDFFGNEVDSWATADAPGAQDCRPAFVKSQGKIYFEANGDDIKSCNLDGTGEAAFYSSGSATKLIQNIWFDKNTQRLYASMHDAAGTGEIDFGYFVGSSFTSVYTAEAISDFSIDGTYLFTTDGTSKVTIRHRDFPATHDDRSTSNAAIAVSIRKGSVVFGSTVPPLGYWMESNGDVKSLELPGSIGAGEDVFATETPGFHIDDATNLTTLADCSLNIVSHRQLILALLQESGGGQDVQKGPSFGFSQTAATLNTIVDIVTTVRGQCLGSYDIGVPAAPSGFTATPLTSSKIDLDWVDNSSDEDGFRLHRRLAEVGLTPPGPWGEVTDTAANVITYEDTGLTQLTKYDYRLQAFNDIGSSDWVYASATTLVAPPARIAWLMDQASGNDIIRHDSIDGGDPQDIDLGATSLLASSAADYCKVIYSASYDRFFYAAPNGVLKSIDRDGGNHQTEYTASHGSGTMFIVGLALGANGKIYAASRSTTTRRIHELSGSLGSLSETTLSTHASGRKWIEVDTAANKYYVVLISPVGDDRVWQITLSTDADFEGYDYATGDVLGLAFDIATNTLWVAHDGGTIKEFNDADEIPTGPTSTILNDATNYNPIGGGNLAYYDGDLYFLEGTAGSEKLYRVSTGSTGQDMTDAEEIADLTAETKSYGLFIFQFA
jgi:hypothetical protein